MASEDKDNGRQQPTYNVDDILAEFGSGKYRDSNVVQFRDPKKGAEQRAEAARQKEAERAAREQQLQEQIQRNQQLREEQARARQEASRKAAEQAKAEAQGKEAKPKPVVERDPEDNTIKFKIPPKDPEDGDQEPPEPKPLKGAAPPDKPKEETPIDEIVPDGVRRKVGARLSAWKRKADNYADHMYENAEPDDDTRKAEKYLPGTDTEEDLDDQDAPRRIFHLKKINPMELPPDVDPAKLAEELGRTLQAQRVRLRFALIFAVLTLLLSLDLPFLADLESTLSDLDLTLFGFRVLAQTGLLVLIGLLSGDVLYTGAKHLITLQPQAESVLFLAWLFTVLDGLTVGLIPNRTFLPYSAVTAIGVFCGLWGTYARNQADRMGARVAASVHTPYIVSLDENMWNGHPAYNKRSDTTNGIGSVLQAEDGPHQVYRVTGPLLVLAGLLAALMASIGQRTPEKFFWCASAVFTAAGSWTALLVYGLPYRKITQRLNRVGAAMAGWPGISRCADAGILMTDLDLFPPGSVAVTQVNVFGGAPTERVVGYTATLIRALDCGLTRPFYNLLKAQGALYREVSGVVVHEGGISGVIRNQEVLVGTASFMHMMEVPMPAGHNIRNAIFCAIDGHLAGLFPLLYTLGDSVAPSIAALIRDGVSPVLATRDPNIIPDMLDRKFHISTEGMDFPAVQRRLELSARNQEHDIIPVAVLSREGITAYCDAVLGGRRLRKCIRMGTAFSLIGSALGLFLTFYLTSIGAFASLTIPNFLVYMAAWLVPEAVLMNWTNRY